MLISVWTGEMYRAVTAQRRGQWHGRSVINAVMTVHTTCVITDQCHTFQLYHSTPLSFSLTPLMADRASICLYICLSDVGSWLRIFTVFSDSPIYWFIFMNIPTLYVVFCYAGLKRKAFWHICGFLIHWYRIRHWYLSSYMHKSFMYFLKIYFI